MHIYCTIFCTFKQFNLFSAFCFPYFGQYDAGQESNDQREEEKADLDIVQVQTPVIDCSTTPISPLGLSLRAIDSLHTFVDFKITVSKT